MRHFILLSTFLYAIPITAAAQCPTRADLENGIRFSLANGDTETFRARPNGLIEALFEASDAPASRVLLAHGVYLLELVDLEDGKPQASTRTTYSYPMKPADLPAPAPDMNWQVRAAVLDMGEIRQENQTYAFGGLSQRSYGPCSYDMFEIVITYPGDPDDVVDLLHYLPALGLSYLAASTLGGKTDIYRYVAIARVN